MRTGTGQVVEEIATALRPAGSFLRRRAAALVVGLGLLLTALCGFALAGAAMHDAAIEADTGVAAAEVLENSDFRRTLVSFVVDGGRTVVPERGVFHPRGLAVGDRIAVEYDRGQPEIARVAGRSWLDGIGPTMLLVAGIWVVLGPAAWRLRRRPE